MDFGSGRLPLRPAHVILPQCSELVFQLRRPIAVRPLDIIVFGSLAAALIGVAWLLFSAPEGGEAWNAFVREHHCQAVGHADGSNRPGWRCDDGKIHYRWRQQR